MRETLRRFQRWLRPCEKLFRWCAVMPRGLLGRIGGDLAVSALKGSFKPKRTQTLPPKYSPH